MKFRAEKQFIDVNGVTSDQAWKLSQGDGLAYARWWSKAATSEGSDRAMVKEMLTHLQQRASDHVLHFMFSSLVLLDYDLHEFANPLLDGWTAEDSFLWVIEHVGENDLKKSPAVLKVVS